MKSAIIIHVQDKCWIDETGRKLRIEKIWATESTKKLLKRMNTEIVIPGGRTSQLQPLDISIKNH